MKRTIVLCLAASYAAVGLFGHTAFLDERIDFFRGTVQLSSTKDSPTVKHRPVWTKKRHFPPTVQTKFHPEGTAHPVPLDPERPCIRTPRSAERILLHLLPSRPSKPRDPPAAVSIAV